MKLEDQVCTPEQSRRLSMLNIAASGQNEPYFYWVEFETSNEPELLNKWALQANEAHIYELRPAFTVAELGVLLRGHLTDQDGKPRNIDLWYDDFVDLYMLKHVTFDGFENIGSGEFKTEAQARAEALIWLLENTPLNPEDLKL